MWIAAEHILSLFGPREGSEYERAMVGALCIASTMADIAMLRRAYVTEG